MKILHVSDLHTRYSRQDEYRSVFSNFYTEAEKVKPDLIVITGDLTNTKANMFPEQVDLTSEFLRNVASISKVLVIPGNHDGLVRNKSRMDALTPIINSLNNENIIYLKDSGKFEFNDIVDFYHVSVFDDDFNIVEPDREDKVNIFLYHGTIEGCILQNGRVVEQSRLKKEMLGKYDVAMLGDIHKEQTIKYNDCIIRQAGSLIQQNFGEELEGHGFTLWDIDKNNVSFKHIEVDNDYKYYNFEFLNNELVSTVRLDNISKYPNIKVKYKDTNIATIEEFLTSLGREYKVYLEDTSMKKINVDSKIDKQIIDDVEYQNSIIESSKLAPESMIKEIKELNRSINEKTVRDDIQKSNIWNIKKIKFKNMFSFGGDIENEIDMENINGLVGIFGKNFQGKSSIFNIISYTLFDKCEKSWLIRDIANFEANDFYCEIVFDINNIEYVVKRYGERKEKTFPVNVEFYRIVDGQKEDLAGSQRKDTNKLITNCVGTYDDFILTTFSVQNDFTGLIDLKQSEIKDMLYRFFNLEYFDKLLKIAKEELKVLEVFYNKVENEDYSGKISYYKDLKSDNKDKQKLIKEEISNLENSIKKIEEEKDILVESLPNIEDVKDIDVSLLERDFENLNKSLLSNKQELARVEELISELEKVNLDGEKIESEIKNLKQKSKDLYLEIKTEKSIVDIDKLEKYVAEERDKDFSLIDEITRDLEELDEYKQISKEVIEEAKQNISLLEEEIKLILSRLGNVERDHQSKITEKKITKITADKLNTIEYDENCPYCKNFVKDYMIAKLKLIEINKEILNLEYEVEIIDSEKVAKESELKEKKLKLSEMEQQNNRVEELIRGLDYLRKQKEDSNKLVLRYLEEIEEANIANKKSIETKESNELIRKEIKYVNGLLDELDVDRQKVNELNKLINVKEKLLNGEKDIELDVREISFKLSMVESKSEQIEKHKTISEKIKAKSLELKDEREMLKSKSEESINLASENKNIDEKVKELNNLIDERNKMFDKVALYKAYCKIVDKNGLPYYIIKNIIPTIEYDANNILKDISEYKLIFELEGSNINIYINYDGKIWSVGTASGMEKFSASIALRVALTNNTNLSRGNFLMIDEGFGTLDSDHLLDVGNMLKSMNNYFKTIFVISHLDFINDIVDDRITIFKDEKGISQINR